jgi:hypothetical protein
LTSFFFNMSSKVSVSSAPQGAGRWRKRVITQTSKEKN